MSIQNCSQYCNSAIATPLGNIEIFDQTPVKSPARQLNLPKHAAADGSKQVACPKKVTVFFPPRRKRSLDESTVQEEGTPDPARTVLKQQVTWRNRTSATSIQPSPSSVAACSIRAVITRYQTSSIRASGTICPRDSTSPAIRTSTCPI